jgi:hypothetical protein
MSGTIENIAANAAVESNVIGFRRGKMRDATGSPIFAHGDIGTAHVVAHRLVDEERFVLGRVWLAEWLNQHSGSGSEWIHLQFHMAVFELATGDFEAAGERFRSEIMPSAATTNLALTDAPGLAWRLELATDGRARLPWEALRQTALRNIDRTSDALVVVHHLLALAGAGHVGDFDRWIAAPTPIASVHRRTVIELARALRASVIDDYGNASQTLENLMPQLGAVGGSGAQNKLFDQTLAVWQLRVREPGIGRGYRDAA